MLIKPVFGGMERIKMEIKITKTTHPKQKPDQSKLGFGIYYTDHMFIMNYERYARSLAYDALIIHNS